MPNYDYKCPSCGRIREVRFSSTLERDGADIRCYCTPGDQFGIAMERQPAAPSHVVNGFNAKNGYSK